MRKSFTLIEIIMIIVIIGILGAVAIPKFINLRRDASNAAAQGNMAAIRSAIAIYKDITAIDKYSWLCTTANSYRSANVSAPCYPASTQEIEESLLVEEPVWYGIGGCDYNPGTGGYDCPE